MVPVGSNRADRVDQKQIQNAWTEMQPLANASTMGAGRHEGMESSLFPVPSWTRIPCCQCWWNEAWLEALLA